MKVPVPLILASQTPQTSHFILSKACSKSCWYTVDERVLAFTEQILNFSIQNELLLPRLTASGRRILVHVQIQSSFSVQSLLSSLPLSLSSLPPSFLPPFQQSHRLLHSATQALFRHTGTHTHFLRHFSTTLRRSKTNTQMDRKTGQGQAPRQPRKARAAGKNVLPISERLQ